MKNLNEKELRKYISKKIQEGYFDEFEFDNDAAEAARRDIEASGEEFEELGSSKFEKTPKFAEKFKSDLNRANLELPSDEEEVERLAKMASDAKRLGKGSLNELGLETGRVIDAEGNPIKLKSPVQHESGVNGFVERFIVGDDNNMKIKVNWVQDSNAEKISNIVSPSELIVKENAMKINEEAYESSRYMFFSNLEQIKRQADLLLNMDEDKLNEILENGHDWAQDHIATAKESIDQVFDFIMNETKDEDDSQNIGFEDTEDESADDFEEEIEEGIGHSHTVGKGENEKPINYPEDLMREAIKKVLTQKFSHLVSENKLNKNLHEGEKYYVVDNDFNQKHYPDLIGKTFDNPPSYAQVKVVKSNEEDEIEESSSDSLINKKGANAKPDASYLKEGLKEDRYEEVIYLQDHEADYALNILKQDGVDDAMDYLIQWHQPGNHDSSNELGIGTSDRTYRRDGYIMYWNPSLAYIGLVYDENPED